MAAMEGDRACLINMIEGGRVALELILVALKISRKRKHCDRERGSPLRVNQHVSWLIIDAVFTYYLDKALSEGCMIFLRGVCHILSKMYGLKIMNNRATMSRRSPHISVSQCINCRLWIIKCRIRRVAGSDRLNVG
jgi:hypothetical protein